MDYSKLIEILKQTSLFDLYRLGVLINHLLENSLNQKTATINQIHMQISKLGTSRLYFL